MNTPLEKANPHITLRPEFTNQLARIINMMCEGEGKIVATKIVKEIVRIANATKECKSVEDLKLTIRDYPFDSTLIRPKVYEDNGCFNSNDLFFECRFHRGATDRDYAAIGVFFPALFKGIAIEDLKLICSEWQSKINDFSRIEFYFTAYYD